MSAPSTKIVGDPIVGDEVDILARKEPDGSLRAVLILRTVPPAPAPTERYQGKVKEIGPMSWTIGPSAGGGPDRVFVVNERTKILGDPIVGDLVGVLARRQAEPSNGHGKKAGGHQCPRQGQHHGVVNAPQGRVLQCLAGFLAVEFAVGARRQEEKAPVT